MGNNKELSPFQNFPWDQLTLLLQLHHSASLPFLHLFTLSQVLSLKTLPQSIMHPNIRDSELSPRELDQWQHLSWCFPHPHVAPLFLLTASTPERANLAKLCPKSHHQLHDYQSGTESQLTCPSGSFATWASLRTWSPYFLSWPLRSIPQPNKGNPVTTWLNHIISLLKNQKSFPSY